MEGGSADGQADRPKPQAQGCTETDTGLHASPLPSRPHHVPRTALCWALSRVRLFATPWTAAHQVPLSMGLSRQEYWRGLPFPTPEDPPDPGIEPASLASPTLAGGFFTIVPPGKPPTTPGRALCCPEPREHNDKGGETFLGVLISNLPTMRVSISLPFLPTMTHTRIYHGMCWALFQALEIQQ